jgi:hypothetical protein
MSCALLLRTRLHMDMADAINVLVHANPREDGSQGCAVWDIFRPEDADGLREFLLEKYSVYRLVDPIHSQLFYLDSETRKELYEKKGIYSHRIYQYPVSASNEHRSRLATERVTSLGTGDLGSGGLRPSSMQFGRLYEDCLRFRQPS